AARVRADLAPAPGPAAAPGAPGHLARRGSLGRLVTALAGLPGSSPAGAAPGRAPVPLARSWRADLPGLADVLENLGLQAGPVPHRAGERPGRLARDVKRAVEVLGGGVGLLRLGHAQVQRVVDELPAVHVPPVDERDRDTGPPGPPGPADAVHVGLLVVRALVVHPCLTVSK